MSSYATKAGLKAEFRPRADVIGGDGSNDVIVISDDGRSVQYFEWPSSGRADQSRRYAMTRDGDWFYAEKDGRKYYMPEAIVNHIVNDGLAEQLVTTADAQRHGTSPSELYAACQVVNLNAPLAS